jgi:D-glucuronyl C5-epimerase C-terminus
LIALVVFGVFAPGADAARVIVLGAHGQAVVRDDPFLTASAVTPPPPPVAPRAVAARSGGHRKRRRPSPPTVHSDLAHFVRTDAITSTAYRGYSATLSAAIGSKNRIGGTRQAELAAVLANMHQLAAAKLLTPSRLPALFATLARNRQWWTTGPLLASGQRVEFAGSQLVWEYYPGQGIELQQLGSFGKADGLYTAGHAHYGQLRQLLSELIPLAARRGGGLTWECYFNFDGGAPPWTSAMSQGTALEALTRGYEAFGDRAYLNVAAHALGIFDHPPPTGVRVGTPIGARYLQYTFAPGASIINAFLQSLIGLYDYAHASGNAQASRLFAAGDAEAKAEVPQFDTGAWSLYQAGLEDTLSYHQLVTGFLHELCSRTQAPVYCTTAQHFDSYLKTPPALQLFTQRARAGQGFSFGFHLSKYSHVGIVVLRGTQIVFETSAYFPYGDQAFSIPPLSRKGTYAIHVGATDLAGNFNRVIGTLVVSR